MSIDKLNNICYNIGTVKEKRYKKMTTEIKMVKEITLCSTLEETEAEIIMYNSLANLHNELVKNDCKALESVITGEIITRDDLLKVLGILDGLLNNQTWKEIE